jgi:hypothetical protein
MSVRPLRILFLVLLGATALSLARSLAEPPRKPSAEEVAFFKKDVLPILEARCFKCHGKGKRARGGLALTSRAGLLKGGDLGPALDPARPEKSRLLQAINWRDGLEMPPSGKLPPKEIDILTRWVKAGAPYPAGSAPAVNPGHKGLRVTAKDRQYWAYRPVKRPVVPAVKDRGWLRNPIDAFVLAKLEAKRLAPAAPAGRVALARRAYYDLTGLPPTPEEVDAFVKDQAPDAYERLVDRLLASPHYGEKWGRHWLDVVRYAETHGYERDSAKPFAWRYRDYVIAAFNRDLPYDRFLTEQLAGDLLDRVTPETLIATGYYRLGIWDDEPADRLLARYDVLDGVVSTTAQAFLGMTVNCARCHDHKKDPIPQRDYYRLLAFFNNIRDMDRDNLRVVPAPGQERTHQEQLRRKAAREAKWYQQIYQLEQRLALGLKKKGLKAADGPASDLVDLKYRFYRDTWERLPDFDALKPEASGPVAHNRITLAPASRREAIGVVFEGKLKVPEAGTYTFYLESTEGARLSVAGKKVIDRPGAGRQAGEAKVELRAGLLPLRLDYFNGNGKPQLEVAWSGPEVKKRALSGGDASGERADLRRLIRRHGAELLGKEEVKRYFSLVRQLDASRRSTLLAPGLRVMCVSEVSAVPTHVLIRGNPRAEGERVRAGFPEVLAEGKAGQPKAGSRLELARWLADAKNPLTARVLVNRLWQHHFNRAIVPTPNDFGKLGEAPTHPELLDWLADELVARGWKMKPLHRLIMTSSAYRMSAKASPQGLRVDPANTLFWRFNMRRLSAEEVRDSILAVSGKLNAQMSGPSVYPPIPREVLAGQSRPGDGWRTSTPEQSARRSVYVHVKRSLLVPILAQHDQADTDSSCAVRYTTTVPTQALGMLNGDFTNEQAAALAARLAREAPAGLPAQVRRAIRLTTGRVPTAEEVRKDVAFVKEMQADNSLSATQALRAYCLLALNTNEFVYLD